MSDPVTFTAPFGFRSAQCCGTCKHWSWGYEGEGSCTRFPSYVSFDGGSRQIWAGAASTDICNDWAEREVNDERPD